MKLVLKTIGNRLKNPYILLFLITIIGYWQVALMHFCLKYDMVDCYYPWRYLVGECLQHHILPLWNPYSAFGQPIHADPQSGAWYPVAWLIGYLRGYDIYAMSFEFILHIYLAGIGMFLLIQRLSISRKAALLTAIAYIFSGLFVGNAQHFTYIISACWIPFILYGFMEIYHHQKIQNALLLSLFLFLQISGGYPAFTFILIYLLIFLFIGFFVGVYTKNGAKALWKYIGLNVLSVIIALALSSVILFSVIQVVPYISRGSGVDLRMAMFCPLSPQALISFILPYATVKDPGFFDTDISMANVYIGLIPLIFFVLSFFIRKPKLLWFFLGFGVFCLLAAMGRYTPVRGLLYHYVPLMNLFRFPSIFRYYVILCFLILAAYAMDKYLDGDKKLRKIIHSIAWSLAGLLAVFVIWQPIANHPDLIDFLGKRIFRSSNSSTLSQHIFFQGILQLLFIGGFILVLIKKTDLKKQFLLFSILLITDGFLNEQLNAPYTVFYSIKDSEVKQYTNHFPRGFPLPSLRNVNLNAEKGISYGPLWKNLNIFHKQIGGDGFTPFRFTAFEILKDSFPSFLDTITANPPVYLTAKVFPADSLKTHYRRKDFSNKYLYLNRKDYAMISPATLQHSPGDTAYFTSFSPVSIGIRVHSEGTQLLSLLQSNFSGWQVSINGKPVPVFTSNLLFMSAIVPPGESEVIFHYNIASVRIAFYVSFFGFITLVITLLILYGNRYRKL